MVKNKSNKSGNILTKEELKIIKLFSENLFGEFTIREIAKKINKKSYNWVFKAVKKIGGLGMINIMIKGGSKICSINLENNLALNYFALIEQQKIDKKLPLKNIRELLDFVPVSYFSFIIAGSYANGTNTKKSDLDVVVIVENNLDSKKVFSILKNKGELMIPKVHIFVFSKAEFLQMLLEKEENYGKEIYRNKIVVFGAENYYLILRRAIEHGFKG